MATASEDGIKHAVTVIATSVAAVTVMAAVNRELRLRKAVAAVAVMAVTVMIATATSVAAVAMAVAVAATHL